MGQTWSIDPYVGKDYGPPSRNGVFSMGVEWMYARPTELVPEGSGAFHADTWTAEDTDPMWLLNDGTKISATGELLHLGDRAADWVPIWLQMWRAGKLQAMRSPPPGTFLVRTAGDFTAFLERDAALEGFRVVRRPKGAEATGHSVRRDVRSSVDL